MANPYVKRLAILLFLGIMGLIMVVSLDSNDVDEICSTDDRILMRLGGTWQCALFSNSTTTILNNTIYTNGSNLTGYVPYVNTITYDIHTNGMLNNLTVKYNKTDSNIWIGRNIYTTATTGAQYNLYIGENVATGATTNTADYNLGIGYNAMNTLTSGASNTAIGTDCMKSITTGSWNTAVGYRAMESTTTANDNTAMGEQALLYNINGNNNAGFGYYALRGVSGHSGANNIAMGRWAGGNVNDGTYNSYLGTECAIYTNDGSYNVGVGYQSLQNIYDGSFNTAVGTQALSVNNNGYNNVAIGYRSLYNNAGIGNIAIGFNSGKYATENNKLYVNHLDRSNEATDKNSSIIYGEMATEPRQQNITFNVGNAIIIGNVTAQFYQGDGSLLTGILTDNTSWNENYANSLYLKLDASNDPITGSLELSDNLAVDTNTLFVDSTSNNVGIGTSSPENALHVVGNMNITGGITSITNSDYLFTGDMVISETEFSNVGLGQLVLIDDNGGQRGLTIMQGKSATATPLFRTYKSGCTVTNPCSIGEGHFIGGWFGYGYLTDAYYSKVAMGMIMENVGVAGIGDGSFIWSTESGAGVISSVTSSEKMRLDGYGRLGIATNAPTSLLHVNGNANITTNLTTTKLCLTEGRCITTWGEINQSTTASGKKGDNIYLYNDTTTIYLNETKLNSTIDNKLLTTTYYPTNVITHYGTESGGNTIGNISYHDHKEYNITEDAGANAMLIYINFTGVEDFNNLLIGEYYEGGAGHEIGTYVYKYDTATWELYDTITDQSERTIINIPIYDISDHIQNEVVRVKIEHLESGIPTHKLSIDFIQLIDGFSTITNTQHDSLSGRDNPMNHPWALSKAEYSGTALNITTLNNTLQLNDSILAKRIDALSLSTSPDVTLNITTINQTFQANDSTLAKMIALLNTTILANDSIISKRIDSIPGLTDVVLNITTINTTFQFNDSVLAKNIQTLNKTKLQKIINDTTPTLGGNLNASNYNITMDTSNKICLDGLKCEKWICANSTHIIINNNADGVIC